MKVVEIKLLKLLGLIISLLFLTACAQPIMPTVQYNKSVDFQVNKNAHLVWEFGKQYSATIPNYSNHNNGLIEVAVSSAINSIDRANNPSRYSRSYGKAEQAIFMTSFRDMLQRNQVFKEVELISESVKIPNKDVLINVFFKTSRVASPEKQNKITLTVTMTITTEGKLPFARTYLVQSDAEGFNASFTDQQIDVSERLLDKLISGIKEWHKLNASKVRGPKK